MTYIRFLFLVAAFTFIGFGQSLADETSFFESIHDVPLMPGLVERVDEAVLFDKPGGRVIESVAEIRGVSNIEVQQYYASSLPQFGWAITEDGQFLRQGERLELVFEAYDDVDVLRVLIRPH